MNYFERTLELHFKNNRQLNTWLKDVVNEVSRGRLDFDEKQVLLACIIENKIKTIFLELQIEPGFIYDFLDYVIGCNEIDYYLLASKALNKELNN